MHGPGFCPQVEGLAGPHLVPVGWESHLSLRVRNLQHFQVSNLVDGGREQGWGRLTMPRALTMSTPRACQPPTIVGWSCPENCRGCQPPWKRWPGVQASSIARLSR